MKIRVGQGYDVHRFAEGRDLYLGCVKIDYAYGLLGHSDADVLSHAIMDALLGACGLRDIGYYFPDTDPRYEGISGTELLRITAKIVRESGYEIENVDSTVICQAPRLKDYIPLMKENVALALGIPAADVGIKATTEEGLGFTGRKEGIAAQAVCLVRTV
ncbi:MAG: 2-C-methyl-D-erythritol 2,4-cyclodiphosphate synthase [Clostridia bacterium]|nr:2-C-methyl-D-erythritol 2,4-cyclodiphosphate synthase [Clostridia bacterium]